jgi:hypothetical protein
MKSREERGSTCSMHGGNSYKIQRENKKKTSHLGDRNINMRIILKWPGQNVRMWNLRVPQTAWHFSTS